MECSAEENLRKEYANQRTTIFQLLCINMLKIIPVIKMFTKML